MKFIIKVLINAFALWVAALIIPGLTISENILHVIIVALVFGLINSIVKPIVKFFSIPFLIVTLGLFTLIINTAMLWFTVKLLPGYIELSGFWSAFWGALVISVISVILHAIIDSDEK